MGIHAVSWALRQRDIPPIPKLLLLALCNRAHEETGECWPGIETIAKDVSLSPRSVVTYMAQLIRNGFVTKQVMRGQSGARRTNHYWVMYDRAAASWIGMPVEENSLSEQDENQDVGAQSANGAHCEDTPADTISTPVCTSQGATACTLHEPSDSKTTIGLVESPRPIAPPGFTPSARAEQVERLKAAEDARKPKRVAVFEGSDPWKYWVQAGHPADLFTMVEVAGKRRRGWWFPSLYPPKTPPPALTPDDRTAPVLSPENETDLNSLADELEGRPR